MAVQVFKQNQDGSYGSAWIEPEFLQNHIDAGWTVDDPEAPPIPGIKILNPKPVDQPLSAIDTDDGAEAYESFMMVMEAIDAEDGSHPEAPEPLAGATVETPARQKRKYTRRASP